MSISWRPLLDAAGISWRDRGANTSRGHINIKCAWCKDDPSYHLTIDETSGAYYCYRAPQHHYGRSTTYLLNACGIPPSFIDYLLQTYASRGYNYVPEEKAPKKIIWDRYELAGDRVYRYLMTRDFENPEHVVRKYDLRIALHGAYAMRLLLPLTLHGEVVGFTGRALRDDLEPRYLTSEPPIGSLYVPSPVAPQTQALVAVEGPMDALKIACAFPGREIIPIALLGLAVPYARLMHIVGLGVGRVLVALDSDQPLSSVQRIINELSGNPNIGQVQRIRIPDPYKDPGEMPIGEIQKWLTSALNQNGKVYSSAGQNSMSNRTYGV